MPLSAAGLGAAIKAKMIAADSSITNQAMVESFANAIADAIVTYFKANGLVVIPAAAIATSGSATNQSGPAVPVNLSIT